MKTNKVMKILEENKITNVLPTKEVFVVKNSRTNKIIEGGFKDKKSAKEKRDELNKPIIAKYTKTNKPKKDSLPLYIVVKGKDHIHYDN